ncbi:hypothetical protein B0H11DRAFT_2206581, partial [Mycena galericulata]
MQRTHTPQVWQTTFKCDTCAADLFKYSICSIWKCAASILEGTASSTRRVGGQTAKQFSLSLQPPPPIAVIPKTCPERVKMSAHLAEHSAANPQSITTGLRTPELVFSRPIFGKTRYWEPVPGGHFDQGCQSLNRLSSSKVSRWKMLATDYLSLRVTLHLQPIAKSRVRRSAIITPKMAGMQQLCDINFIQSDESQSRVVTSDIPKGHNPWSNLLL